MTDLERYEKALKEIGTAQLLSLPEQVKEVLKSTKDLKVKTEMLEKIAKNI